MVCRHLEVRDGYLLFAAPSTTSGSTPSLIKVFSIMVGRRHPHSARNPAGILGSRDSARNGCPQSCPGDQPSALRFVQKMRARLLRRKNLFSWWLGVYKGKHGKPIPIWTCERFVVVW